MKRITTLFVLLLFILAVEAGGIKKWVDDDGNVHFGDTPPPSQSARRIQVRDPATGNGSMVRPDVIVIHRDRPQQSTEAVAPQSRDYGERLRYRNAAVKGEILNGMTKTEVMRAWGEPDEVDVSDSGSGRTERWWWWDHSGSRLKSKYIRFEDDRVTNWSIDR
ncbi:DUF4124 domain-containing protein [Sedimenticola selenatireducens]|uniref:DUF4124 domain-containing protein n=1 Tax=Sedimenticola selenatireducens TaxID=191960 RepID=UPI002AABF2A4|nr:DUF4124 domain-containing protein [Sedimenticola selenatireducens]